MELQNFVKNHLETEEVKRNDTKPISPGKEDSKADKVRFDPWKVVYF